MSYSGTLKLADSDTAPERQSAMMAEIFFALVTIDWQSVLMSHSDKEEGGRAQALKWPVKKLVHHGFPGKGKMVNEWGSR